jgi:hypothetical protein
MCKSKIQAVEIRDEFQECGHSLSLLIDLCTSDVQLTERSKLALTQYGKHSLDRFEHAEAMLRDYEIGTAPN